MLVNKGQSLIEILVALAIFILVISVIFAIVGGSFLNIRQGQETLQAVFLAQEGLEAVRSIRDYDWTNLINGSYGLATIANQWILSGIEEDIGSQLNQGKRQMTISDDGPDRKLITAKISWELLPGRSNEVELFTVLANWRKISEQPGTCQGTATACQDLPDQSSCQNQDNCLWTPGSCNGHCYQCVNLSISECLNQQGCYVQQVGKKLKCRGQCLNCNNFIEQDGCLNQLGCTWQPAVCSSTAVSCDYYTNQSKCENQSGCVWIPN